MLLVSLKLRLMRPLWLVLMWMMSMRYRKLLKINSLINRSTIDCNINALVLIRSRCCSSISSQISCSVSYLLTRVSTWMTCIDVILCIGTRLTIAVCCILTESNIDLVAKTHVFKHSSNVLGYFNTNITTIVVR